jgi:hypothetical protein
MSTNSTTADMRIGAARQAVTDECGSLLCMWVDRGTERICRKDYSNGGICLCESVARAAVEAADGALNV